MKVLFASAEVFPFAAAGGLGDVAAALPKALVSEGVDCRVALPFYATVDQSLRGEMLFLGSFPVQLGEVKEACGVYALKREGVIYYFLDNKTFFGSGGIYGLPNDGQRFAFFSKAVTEMAATAVFEPDVIHASDWHTALVPVFLALQKEQGKPVPKTVFTIHNIQFQGGFPLEYAVETLGFDDRWQRILAYGGGINFMKGAFVTADRVNTVSPTYAKEVQTEEYSFNLHPIIAQYAHKFSGILNGIDTALYDPAKDPALPHHYDATSAASGKAANKKALRRELGLEQDASPLLAMVTRLTDQKGVQLVAPALEKILDLGLQVVILGSGDKEAEKALEKLSALHPGRFALRTGFIPELARRIYAGADLFLMPSKFEPCGLSQMIALRYGALPVVRATGGLADTVREEIGKEGKKPNGFTFTPFTASDMLAAIQRAYSALQTAPRREKLVLAAMEEDNSWRTSAKEYIALYKQ